jgi:pyruvate,orthophosphate dikinase
LSPSPEQLRLLRLVVFAGAIGDKSDITGFEREKLDYTLDALKEAGLIEYDDIIAPSAAGLDALDRWYASDRATLGSLARDALLERFRPLDRELKRIAREWQNAVSKDDWDERLQNIEALTALHEKTSEYFEQPAASLARFAEFRRQLDGAIEKVLDGETDYFVGVRCDSYHTVWFRLHEDLLRLLQREREED